MSSQDDTSRAAAETLSVGSDVLAHLAHDLRGSAGVILGALHELEVALGDGAREHEAMFAMARRGVARIAVTANRLQAHGRDVSNDVGVP